MGASFSVLISISLMSLHLCNGLGRYQTSPGMFIPIENVFTSRVKRTWVITNYSSNSNIAVFQILLAYSF